MDWTKVQINPLNTKQILFPNGESIDFHVKMVKTMACQIGLVIEDIYGNIVMLKEYDENHLTFIMLQKS